MLNTYESVVNAFYLAYFGRPADPAGLAFWSQQLENANGDPGIIAAGFTASEEAADHFAGIDVAGQVAAIYQQLFDRAPDVSGLEYWTDAIEKGEITVAGLAIGILQGAQSSDSAISMLRQQAAAEFTAAVADSGIKFVGSAAVEASRALIAAVDGTTTQESIAAMVKTAGTLVNIAHDTPAVIGALGAGGKLAPLFATVRGKAEPENLLQTLTDLARTAAGNPSTLDSLLRGGGMNKVLEVMPSQATLHDVVEALGKGGLPAAVEVVYPGTPAEPGPEPVTDNVAPLVKSIVIGPNDGNLAVLESIEVKVAFDARVSVDGTPSILFANGGSAVYSAGSGTDTLVFKYLPQPGQSTPALALAQDAAFSGIVRDLAGNKLPAHAFDGLALGAAVAVDAQAPVQTFTFAAIQTSGAFNSVEGSNAALATNLVEARVIAILSDGLGEGEQVEYSLDNGQTWSVQDLRLDGPVVAVDKVSTAGNPTVMLRVIDAAGNAGTVASRAIIHDTVAPDAGTLAFLKVSESLTDGQHDNVTNQATVSVTFSHAGAWPAAGERLEYSIDGSQWSSAGLQLDQDHGRVTIDGIDLTQAPVNDDATRTTSLSVRAIDVAGNVAMLASQDLVYDNEVNAPSLALDTDSAGSYGSATDNITNAGAYHAVGIEAGGHAEYSLSGSGGWSGTAPDAIEGPNKVYVRQVDGAGNVSAANAIEFTLDTAVPLQPIVELALDSGASPADNVTRSGQVVVTGLDGSGAWAYSLDGGDTWLRGASPVAGEASLDVSGDGTYSLLVRQYDVAGNASTDAALDFKVDTKAALLVFDHVQGYTTAVNVTGLTKANVVFGYEGRVDEADKVEYQVDGGGWQSVGANAVDTGTQTITLRDVDLAGTDPKVELRVIDVAGNQSNTASVDIDGPYAAPLLTVTATIRGLMVTSPVDGDIQLAGSSIASPVYTDDGGGALAGVAVLVGAQMNVLGGVVQVAPAAGSPLADASGTYYTLGTDDGDTFSGVSHAWGFGGNDTFTGTSGADVLYTGDGVNTVTAGAGADTIDISLGQNTLNYSAGHSTVNGGMDVVTFARTASANTQVQTFHFDTMPATSYRIDNVANPADASNAALVAALDAAYRLKTGNEPTMAVVIEFQNHDTYLVVDTGNAVIDGNNDYVVKLVGYVADPYVMAGDVIFGAAP